MMKPESTIDFSSKNYPLYLRDFQTKCQHSSAVCGVQIEMVGELWGLPCFTRRNLSLFT